MQTEKGVMGDVIKQNGHVVVCKVNGQYPRSVKLSRRKTVLIEKLKFMPDAAFGKPFGSVFNVLKGNQLQVAEVLVPSSCKVQLSDDTVQDNPVPELDSDPVVEGDPDQSSPCKQKMSEEDVALMKLNGADSGAIVSKLVAGNAQYAQRTVYSQEKYVQRKSNKHADQLIIFKPNLRLVAESFYHKEPDRVLCLSADILSEMVVRANVHTGSRVLVLEQCQGLLTAAAVQRMGGTGNVVHLHEHNQAQGIPCLYAMDFTPQELSVVQQFPVWNIIPNTESESGSVPYKAQLKEQYELDNESVAQVQSTSSKVSTEQLIERRQRRAHKALRLQTVADWLNQRQMDCALMAVRSASVLPSLRRLCCFLRPCAPICVYSHTQQPLMAVYDYLKGQERAVDIRLTDCFIRDYQVLPERTHPLMTQQVAGGFLLSAIIL